ncbi:MAG: hypothetical protein IPM80_00015 [Proteobacteria bacterium]|nr:hypothetical protein [Pseudomonadota bacterium]
MAIWGEQRRRRTLPCSARAASSTAALLAQAATSEARITPTVPHRKMRRRPVHVGHAPGSTRAAALAKQVAIGTQPQQHHRVDVERLAMAGKATLTVDSIIAVATELSMIMTTAKRSASRARCRRAAGRSCNRHVARLKPDPQGFGAAGSRAVGQASA